MNICVIGTGYVGLVTGACFAEFGLNVTCVDKDENKIKYLKAGKSPIYEPGLEELIQRNTKQGRLMFTTNVEEGVKSALVVFIAVGTPPKQNGESDLKYIKEVAKQIAHTMDGYKVIVTKSTVPVGTGKMISDIVKKNQKSKVNFDIASNPEFLREGSAIEDFLRPNRVVIGTSSDQAVAILKDLYRPLYLIESPFVVTNIETAEMIKYASNAFLATKISFINEIANLCERVGADVHMVSKGMGLDKRIGSKFLHPGPGFGGSCFPKDTRALAQIAKNNGYELKIVNAVMEVNKEQINIMIEKIKSAIDKFKGKTIGILGLSFKPNTDDIRESPAIELIKILEKRGSKIRVYDPVALDNTKEMLRNNKITYCKDSYEVATGANVLVIATEWNQFRMLDMKKVKKLLKDPVLVDLRNVYDPVYMKNLGFSYSSVGRV
ncbi:MAG: UDP-glucose/GDP-mannose dehydrogenase family protein [Candidatus Scalindua sp.]|nr:UDP-glucose/GDP-mannose dehydrogenase family protein [Candidatus Scalindua sp.]